MMSVENSSHATAVGLSTYLLLRKFTGGSPDGEMVPIMMPWHKLTLCPQIYISFATSVLPLSAR